MTNLLLLLQEHAAAPAQGGGGEAHVATPFDINPGLMLWTVGIFLLLMGVLWRFAWPAIVGSVEERERRIQKQLDEAAAARTAAQQLLEQHKALIAGARTEAQDLLAKAKGAAQKERDALVAKGHEEQERLLERARKEIADERDKAVQALRREAVDLAIAAASRLVESNLDSDANRRLVTEYLAALKDERH
jgi:F-type H+-transporting ATPase subunit b